MRLRPEEKPKKEYGKGVGLFLALLFTLGYIFLLEYGLWLLTHNTHMSTFVRVHFWLGIMFGWIPMTVAWIAHDIDKKGGYDENTQRLRQ